MNKHNPTHAEMVKAGEIATVESMLEEMPENFVTCRDMRHAWSIEHDFYVYESDSNTNLLTIARDLICMRCTTIRREVFVKRLWGLDKVRNSYLYVDGYQLRGLQSGGHNAAQAVRDLQYNRAMDKIAKVARDAHLPMPPS